MAEAIHTLKRLLELGIDFIDTADSYGPEVSEQLIRQVLYIPITGRPGEVLVTSAQIRAARGLLDWTVRDLAERSGVHRDMANKIETGAYAGPPGTLEAIRRTLEYAGVELTNGDALGVKLRKR
jgi:hypothetical protein